MTGPSDRRDLHAERVRFTRGRRLVIDDVDCTVPGGSVGALLGPNGAGKSTTVSMIAGLITPASGAVLVDGDPLTGHTDPAKRKAYLAQINQLQRRQVCHACQPLATIG